MIDTILFDLDGTLLHFSQEAFMTSYFRELTKVFLDLRLEPEASIQAVWAGTRAMVKNDGSKPNIDRFWAVFAETLQLSAELTALVEAACNRFYTDSFHLVKSVVQPNDVSKRLVCALASKGFTAVLSTNPLFPACAVESRLSWIGLAPEDFCLVTHYANSTYCKPNLGYFKEIFAKINKAPAQCLVVGNNPIEDMCAGELGAETYLVTDCLENEKGIDISAFRQGRLPDLEAYIMSLPDALSLP